MSSSQYNGGRPMRDIRVTQTEGGKFQVLINFVRRGIEFSTKEQAENEKKRIIEKEIA